MDSVWEYILLLLNLEDAQRYGPFVAIAGYYFCPRPYQLLVYYLAKTILGLDPPIDLIRRIGNLYKLEPNQMPVADFTTGKPEEAYFFTTREPNEAETIVTKNGYWGIVEEDEEDEEYEEDVIEYENHVIGFKKTYAFYEGNAPSGIKSPWLLREYRFNSGLLPSNLLTDDLKTKMDTMVVCKIKDTGYEARTYKYTVLPMEPEEDEDEDEDEEEEEDDDEDEE